VKLKFENVCGFLYFKNGYKYPVLSFSPKLSGVGTLLGLSGSFGVGGMFGLSCDVWA
jgi:hypothetical protein